MKKCCKCQEIKSYDEFNRQNKCLDNRHSWCRKCDNLNSNQHRVNNLEKSRNTATKWNNIIAKRKVKKNKVVDYYAKHPSKYNAKDAVFYALEKKLITKPLDCSKCMAERVEVYAHHKDYGKPLEIIWLCLSCSAL